HYPSTPRKLRVQGDGFDFRVCYLATEASYSFSYFGSRKDSTTCGPLVPTASGCPSVPANAAGPCVDRVTWGTNMEMGGLGGSGACRSGEAVTRYRRPWLPLDFGINQRPCPGLPGPTAGLDSDICVVHILYAARIERGWRGVWWEWIVTAG